MRNKNGRILCRVGVSYHRLFKDVCEHQELAYKNRGFYGWRLANGAERASNSQPKFSVAEAPFYPQWVPCFTFAGHPESQHS